MGKRGKKYTAVKENLDPDKGYDVSEALQIGGAYVLCQV